ncbi:Eco29kI family restriction endonuclease [Pleomorphomonas sp. PLEO]|uniref:Eco29kI family restriction endonuclease n=1 Tax=Pleomorphomonas sp. PLEO TaxID=3239306 RepID=UPI00351DE84A
MRDAANELGALGPSLTTVMNTRVRRDFFTLLEEMEKFASSLDPVLEPRFWFDPADQRTAGNLVAAALISQQRVPLNLIQRSYGAGVYAIYYVGDHPLYAPISASETPIYVGKADPQTPMARRPRDQGEKLYGRLSDHRKMIRTVSAYAFENNLPNPLRIEDFECRRLVTASNAQMHAESHLISMFKPVWNAETRICWGISKHGDTEGRNNARSPWDVIHPGRKWAMLEKLEDSRPPEKILTDVTAHFENNPPFNNRDALIKAFMDSFSQDPMIAAEAVKDDEQEPEDASSSP